MVSEISEAMEGARKDLMDDKLPHRKMEEVELADLLIRLLDYSVGFNFNIGEAFEEKMAFNSKRIDHTYEAREATGGKKW
jgi:NTP pyrophosphatase (non-canonical NTP hydrolase)